MDAFVRLSYAVAIVMPALDAIFPALPSETAIIALGVATADSVGPRIALLVACATLDAFLGDNLSSSAAASAPGRNAGSSPAGKARGGASWPSGHFGDSGCR